MSQYGDTPLPEEGLPGPVPAPAPEAPAAPVSASDVCDEAAANENIAIRLPPADQVPTLPPPRYVELKSGVLRYKPPDAETAIMIGRLDPVGLHFLTGKCQHRMLRDPPKKPKECNLWMTSPRWFDDDSIAEKALKWWLLHGYLAYGGKGICKCAKHEADGKVWRAEIYKLDIMENAVRAKRQR